MADLLTRQFDVFPNPERSSRDRIPYLVVLQSDRYDETRGAVVAPLVPVDAVRLVSRLYPIVEVENARYAVVVSELATAPRSILRRPITHLAEERDRIIAALDLLFTGI